MNTNKLKSFTIDDDLSIASRGAIEVTVSMENGERRWCFFFTPEGLSRCGDMVDGSAVRVHPGVAHMIVVSRIDEGIIEKVLCALDVSGALLEHTIPRG